MASIRGGSTARSSSWILLGVGINGAVYTANALLPRRGRLLFGPSFFASWITIELAWFHILWQALAGAVLVRRGALAHRPGRVGLGLLVAALGGLAVVMRHSFDVRREIRGAMEDFAHERAEAKGLPVRVRRNIVFSEVAARRLRLDVWEPAVAPEAGTRRPVLVQVHGGGWVVGDKREQGRLICRRMASEGWVCANVNYRLSPAATFPDHLVDIKRAIAWIREHAEELHIDPGFIAITGGSAGGHLATLAGLTSGDRSLQPGFEEADTSVQAAVPFYAVFDFTNRNGHMPEETVPRFIEPIVMKARLAEEPERFAQASPLDQVRRDAPPFLVIHGDRDTLAPVQDARDFVARLRAASDEPVYYLELHGAQHAFELFWSFRAKAVIDAAAHFLDGVFHAYRKAGGELEPELVRQEVEAELDEADLELVDLD